MLESLKKRRIVICNGNNLYHIYVILIKNGPNIDLHDSTDLSALEIASAKRNESAVELVIERGVRLNIKSMKKQTTLTYAARWADGALVKFSLTKKPMTTQKLHMGTQL